eukprot:4348861-Pleurochrysis_carterae.AAC.1
MQVSTTTWSVAARARGDQRMAASGDRCRRFRRAWRRPARSGRVFARWRPGMAQACAEHGGNGDREVDRGVIELLVHFLDESHGPHEQCRRRHETQFDRARGAITRGIEIEMRNVGHQHRIRTFS